MNGTMVDQTRVLSIPKGVGTAELTIGAHLNARDALNNNLRFPGIIDEVRISNVARYMSDFTPQRRLAADENTVALYDFDDGQGALLRDSSGNDHHGIIHGATWVQVDDQLNIVGAALARE